MIFLHSLFFIHCKNKKLLRKKYLNFKITKTTLNKKRSSAIALRCEFIFAWSTGNFSGYSKLKFGKTFVSSSRYCQVNVCSLRLFIINNIIIIFTFFFPNCMQFRYCITWKKNLIIFNHEYFCVCCFYDCIKMPRFLWNGMMHFQE